MFAIVLKAFILMVKVKYDNTHEIPANNNILSFIFCVPLFMISYIVLVYEKRQNTFILTASRQKKKKLSEIVLGQVLKT